MSRLIESKLRSGATPQQCGTTRGSHLLVVLGLLNMSRLRSSDFEVEKLNALQFARAEAFDLFGTCSHGDVMDQGPSTGLPGNMYNTTINAKPSVHGPEAFRQPFAQAMPRRERKGQRSGQVEPHPTPPHPTHAPPFSWAPRPLHPTSRHPAPPHARRPARVGAPPSPPRSPPPNNFGSGFLSRLSPKILGRFSGCFGRVMRAGNSGITASATCVGAVFFSANCGHASAAADARAVRSANALLRPPLSCDPAGCADLRWSRGEAQGGDVAQRV